MCNFFSFVTNGKGDLFYFNADERRFENGNQHRYDSHSSICDVYKINEDACNKYELIPTENYRPAYYSPAREKNEKIGENFILLLDQQNSRNDDFNAVVGRMNWFHKSEAFLEILLVRNTKGLWNTLSNPNISLDKKKKELNDFLIKENITEEELNEELKKQDLIKTSIEDYLSCEKLKSWCADKRYKTWLSPFSAQVRNWTEEVPEEIKVIINKAHKGDEESKETLYCGCPTLFLTEASDELLESLTEDEAVHWVNAYLPALTVLPKHKRTNNVLKSIIKNADYFVFNNIMNLFLNKELPNADPRIFIENAMFLSQEKERVIFKINAIPFINDDLIKKYLRKKMENGFIDYDELFKTFPGQMNSMLPFLKQYYPDFILTTNPLNGRFSKKEFKSELEKTIKDKKKLERLNGAGFLFKGMIVRHPFVDEKLYLKYLDLFYNRWECFPSIDILTTKLIMKMCFFGVKEWGVREVGIIKTFRQYFNASEETRHKFLQEFNQIKNKEQLAILVTKGEIGKKLQTQKMADAVLEFFPEEAYRISRRLINEKNVLKATQKIFSRVSNGYELASLLRCVKESNRWGFSFRKKIFKIIIKAIKEKKLLWENFDFIPNYLFKDYGYLYDTKSKVLRDKETKLVMYLLDNFERAIERRCLVKNIPTTILGAPEIIDRLIEETPEVLEYLQSRFPHFFLKLYTEQTSKMINKFINEETDHSYITMSVVGREQSLVKYEDLVLLLEKKPAMIKYIHPSHITEELFLVFRNSPNRTGRISFDIGKLGERIIKLETRILENHFIGIDRMFNTKTEEAMDDYIEGMHIIVKEKYDWLIKQIKETLNHDGSSLVDYSSCQPFLTEEIVKECLKRYMKTYPLDVVYSSHLMGIHLLPKHLRTKEIWRLLCLVNPIYCLPMVTGVNPPPEKTMLDSEIIEINGEKIMLKNGRIPWEYTDLELYKQIYARNKGAIEYFPLHYKNEDLYK